MGINYIVVDSEVLLTEGLVGERTAYHLGNVVTPRDQSNIPEIEISLRDQNGRSVYGCICRRVIGNWIGNRVRLEEIKDHSGRTIARWTDGYETQNQK